MSQIPPTTASFIAITQAANPRVVPPRKQKSAQELRNTPESEEVIHEQVDSTDIVESIADRPANRDGKQSKRKAHEQDPESESDDSAHLDITA